MRAAASTILSRTPGGRDRPAALPLTLPRLLRQRAAAATSAAPRPSQDRHPAAQTAAPQDTPPAATAETVASADDADIVVTGSRIVANGFNAPTPTTVVGEEQIANNAQPNVFNTIGAIGISILLFAFVFIWQGKKWRFKMAKRYKYYARRQFDPRPIGG